jgi:hypothetical protein
MGVIGLPIKGDLRLEEIKRSKGAGIRTNKELESISSWGMES